MYLKKNANTKFGTFSTIYTLASDEENIFINLFLFFQILTNAKKTRIRVIIQRGA